VPSAARFNVIVETGVFAALKLAVTSLSVVMVKVQVVSEHDAALPVPADNWPGNPPPWGAFAETRTTDPGVSGTVHCVCCGESHSAPDGTTLTLPLPDRWMVRLTVVCARAEAIGKTRTNAGTRVVTSVRTHAEIPTDGLLHDVRIWGSRRRWYRPVSEKARGLLMSFY
jgi:hypothetical protein